MNEGSPISILFSMKYLAPLFLMAAMANATNDFEAKINQIGYGEQAKKILVYKNTDAQSVEFRDLSSGKAVLSAPLSAAALWEHSGELARKADFSAISKPGLYAAYANGIRVSDNIFVRNDVYEDVFKASLKWFYYQRASMALSPEFAGKWARAAGHPDAEVFYYPEGDKPDLKISSPKGWYDAGDYGKYIVNSGISVFTLMELYEHFEAQLKKLSLNIPESKSKTPDILEEIRWNLDWMLTMQDPQDGGVYHKLTTARFSGHVMPDADLAKRYVVMKTTPAALNFAAAMAQASRLYKPFDPKFSEKALAAAEKAFKWATDNPVILFKQPEGMNTGPYNPSDETARDEKLWAAAELYASAKKKMYADAVDSIPFNGDGPWWGNVNFLAVYRIADAKSGFRKELTKAAQDTMLSSANTLRAMAEASSYGLPVAKWNFVWGSNSAVANNGIMLLHAYYLTKDKGYLDAAQRALDYLLGANPLGMSFVTGYGSRAPLRPHHRPSEADAIFEPVPGMLAGGPHEGGQDRKPGGKCDDYVKKGKPALSYIDDDCSYATNEVAINWNAPLAYLAGAIHFLNMGAKR